MSIFIDEKVVTFPPHPFCFLSFQTSKRVTTHVVCNDRIHILTRTGHFPSQSFRFQVRYFRYFTSYEEWRKFSFNIARRLDGNSKVSSFRYFDFLQLIAHACCYVIRNREAWLTRARCTTSITYKIHYHSNPWNFKHSDNSVGVNSGLNVVSLSTVVNKKIGKTVTPNKEINASFR